MHLHHHTIMRNKGIQYRTYEGEPPPKKPNFLLDGGSLVVQASAAR